MNKMLVFILRVSLLIIALFPTIQLKAQLGIAEVIQAGVVKAIKAMDIRIQRKQNEVLWQQNAQRIMENELSRVQLLAISESIVQQRGLYQNYYSELSQVKIPIKTHQRILNLTERHRQISQTYQRVWSQLQANPEFSLSELEWMDKVYKAIFLDTERNLQQLELILESSKLQMSDADRLELVHEIALKIQTNHHDLARFNQSNIILGKNRLIHNQEKQNINEILGHHK